MSKFETPTGARLRLRRIEREPAETFLDPLELEGLTRARHKPFSPLHASKGPPDESLVRAAAGERLERLQNEFALVGVAVARSKAGEALLIRDMNAGLGILLTADELEALLPARHMEFAPLVDTSDLVAIPEPDIDEV
ncbi:MAG: hypothetical protein ACT4P5_02690 [Armatimonadota bacterium]